MVQANPRHPHQRAAGLLRLLPEEALLPGGVAMSGHDYIHRQRWWSWDDDVRSEWTAWFDDHDLSVDDISEFHVHEDIVAVNVYLRNEEGKPYAVRGPGDMETAQKRIEIKHDGFLPPIPDAAGTRI